ncbi:peptide deformylase [Candidatus Nomurabacteria bacterium]|uniref:Peptide deformylase n=1 Tax=candidate division WWE3 bacterium TaxID=2053526 RepID=A0A955IVZ3_UNCKA|nr:peptide deformylase [candidate division WWE3 bacterium]MCB9823652.1 peptide deformylase [Candidatus Nomurabacteria bacterium]MCB9827270.1 peptide deformylase [Candidatus Nomurabacteria bacterium]MCB9827447.1 peptide deformylase [Candidatus Nomurabacteria bacterium]HXK52778.1 peptide deformylase [bacterium]
MAIKEIVKVNKEKTPEVLLKQCAAVSNFDTETESLAQDLIDTLNAKNHPEGAGLAAPQIGVLKRICLVKKYISESQELEIIMINPDITSKSSTKKVDLEACLSIPNVYGYVQRSTNITVSFYDIKGRKHKIKASGFLARVIQHEIDHLDGILFTTKTIGKVYTEEEVDHLI